ncbi:hypothetical protein Tco_0275146 [Tanacetum coccineum]
MMRIKTKNPPLDQTGGPREDELEKNLSQPVHQRKRPLRQLASQLKEPTHQEFETGVTEDQPDEETSQLPDWFQRPGKLPSPDRDWNKTLPDAHGPIQPWISSLARMEDPRESINVTPLFLQYSSGS